MAHIEFFHNHLGVPNVGFVLETCCCYRDDAVEDLDLFLVADIVAYVVDLISKDLLST